MDYFTRLGLAVDYNISADKLELQYLECQKKYHPDKYVNKPEEERLKATETIIEINQAYNILKSDIKRAEYILLLCGIKIGDEIGAFKASSKILLEAMTDRQVLEDVKGYGELREILKETQDQINHELATFKMNLRENNIEQAANIVMRLRYKNKFLEEIELKLYA